MTLLFYAQPYDISAEGFYFRSMTDYTKQVKTIRNSCGNIVEEFEIQYIDGGLLNAEFAKAWQINQANIGQFIEAANEWDEEDKIRFILAVGECGYGFDPDDITSDDFEVDIYRHDSMRDLAVEFIEEGIFGDVPKRLQHYIDYDAIARDLEMDYSEAIIAGEHLIFRCA